MKLVDNWKQAHKWLSMQISALGLAAVAVWGYIPQEWRDFILRHESAQYLIAAAFLAIMIGRVTKQDIK